MRLLFSSMLLASFCAPVSWSAPATTKGLSLIQSPDFSVTEGESINITCCWSGLVGKIRVNWMKDGKNRTEVKYKSVTVANKTELDKERESLTCSLFTLESVMIEHSGNYTCLLTVEIPKLARHEGKGTTVTVTTKNNTATSTTTDEIDPGPGSTHTLVIALAVVVPLLLIVIICYCKLRRKRASTARVIYEVPHHDSDLTDIDKHSTGSSTGSSHWCQVPVYESFDYFEQVQTKHPE